jgi:methionyl aminopeptidase
MKLKTPAQIKQMREAGLLLWETHQIAFQAVTDGITTAELNAEIEAYIDRRHAIPLFKGVPGVIPFPAAACISVNEEVVHGIPSNRKLRDGDIVSIDIGVKLNGWCADSAVTYAVGTVDRAVLTLLTVTEQMLRESIELLKTNTKWNHIARKVSRNTESAGFTIVEDLVGHGIGRELWEVPQVPNFYSPHSSDFRIRPGVVIAIEPMVNMGTKRVRTAKDGWTVVTADGRPSAHFEHTVAVTEDGPVVLTCGPNGEGWAM